MKDPAQNPYVANSQTLGGSLPRGRAAGTINAAARTGIVISFALISGVSVITAIMAFLILSNPPEDQSLIRLDGDAVLFLVVGYVFFLGGVAATLVLRRIMKGQAVAQFRSSAADLPQPLDGDSQLPSSGQAFVGAIAAYTLVGQALLEGPAVANAIFMLLENNFAHLLPIALAVIGIALQIPTAGKIKELMENAMTSRT